MGAKQRKVIIAITILYTILILYFLFLGFGRTGSAERANEYNIGGIDTMKFPLGESTDSSHQPGRNDVLCI